MNIQYWLKRLAVLPVMCLAVSFVTFSMIYLAPGDAAALIAGPRASAEQIAQVQEDLGLDQPLLAQYVAYLQRVLTGDLGTTITGRPVTDVIVSNAGPTVLLVVMSLGFTVVLTLVGALGAARRPGGVVDTVVKLLSTGLLGMPAFWIGIMLLLFLALPTGWFPVGGWPATFPEQVRASTLPALALSLTLVPVLIRGLRASLISVSESEYVAVGKSLGLYGGRLGRRYVMRNATIPVVPLIANMLGVLIGSTAVVEATFGLPGLGQALVVGATQREASLVQGITLVFAILIVVIQLTADLVLAALDPRVRLR